jgi:predicted molibdopterin-dependent oxidoreductase YjgC
MNSPRFVRLAETGRARITLRIDDVEVHALEGDTLLVAMLGNVGHLRHAEFGDEVRSGFCLMGACQDCWVRDEQGERMRACSTLARDGMQLRTAPQELTWPSLA